MTEYEKELMCRSAVRTAKPFWCNPWFRKWWYEQTGEKIRIAPALVNIKTGEIVRWLDEEKK